jgi:hypothetical protein
LAIVIEDGTGKPNAESYASVAFATAYHSDRGNAAWAALSSDIIREQLLRKATGYMEQVYRARWKSFRVTITQSLSWPRAWVPVIDAPSGYGAGPTYVANNIVPIEVQQACAELALIASTADLAPALPRPTVRERVGDIDVEYNRYAPEFTRYRAVDMLLGPLLTGSAVSSQLIRA